MEIRETSNMDLSEYIGPESIHLTAGRSNNVIVDNKVFLHNVRSIHFANGDGYHVEFVCCGEGMETQEVYVYDVSSIFVESVYGERQMLSQEPTASGEKSLWSKIHAKIGMEAPVQKS